MNRKSLIFIYAEAEGRNRYRQLDALLASSRVTDRKPPGKSTTRLQKYAITNMAWLLRTIHSCSFAIHSCSHQPSIPYAFHPNLQKRTIHECDVPEIDVCANKT